MKTFGLIESMIESFENKFLTWKMVNLVSFFKIENFQDPFNP